MALARGAVCDQCGSKIVRRKGWEHCPTYQCKVDSQFTETKEYAPGCYKFKRLGEPYYD